MRWADALQAILSRLASDPELLVILGGAHVYRAAPRRALRVPSVEYTIVAAVPTERYETMLVQFDIFGSSYQQVVSIEERLRATLHRELPEVVNGVWMFMQWVAARDHGDTDEGIVHRSIDFDFQPVRDP